MPAFVRHPWFTCLLTSLGVLLALGGFWYTLGKPVHLPDAVIAARRLQCASYTPFDKDQSPFDQPFTLRQARVDADLALLAERFQCIRTYSMTGLEAVPALARRHGLKLMLGAWVSADPEATEREVTALITVANANPDLVTLAIVGNEVLLRNEMPSERLLALIERVKRQVQVPVTYADVWALWIPHPQITAAVDVVTLHLLPYWEGDSHDIESALARIAKIRREFGERLAPKPVLIGETGWPSAGRQREAAVPSRVDQARFLRSFIALAHLEDWDYNLIEAFDQPWKRASEGAVGGYWGLYDADRQDKHVLEGPVSKLPTWRGWWLASAVLLVLVLVLAGGPRHRLAGVGLPLLGGLAAIALGLWAQSTYSQARDIGEWSWAVLLIGLNLTVLAHAALALGQRGAWRQRVFTVLQTHAGGLLLAAGFAAAASMVALVFDARFRSFPSAALLVPAVVYLVRPVAAPRLGTALLGATLALGIVPQLQEEGLANGQALRWAAVSLLMVGALGRGWWLQRHKPVER